MGLIAWSVICTISATYLIADGLRQLRLVYLLVVTIFFIVGAVLICEVFVPRRRDTFAILPWSLAFFLLVFGVRSVDVLLNGSAYLGEPPFDSATRAAFQLALFYAIVGLVAFLGGYYSRLGVALANSLQILPRRWNRRRARTVILVLAGVGIVGNVVLTANLGGLRHYLLNKSEVLNTGMGGNYYVAWLGSMTGHSLFVAYAFWLAERRFCLLTWSVLFPLNVALGLGSGSKGAFLSTFLTLVMIFHYLKRRVSLKFMTLFVVAALSTFPVFNAYRGNFKDWSELWSNVRGMSVRIQDDKRVLVVSLLHRFTGIDMLTIAVRDTPRVAAFQFGKTLAPIAVAWIPRGLWEGKPVVSFGRVFAVRYLGSEDEAAAPTILGEGYINFHVVGIIGICVTLGLLSRGVYHYCIVRGLGISGVYAYVMFFESLVRAWEWNIPGWVTGFLPSVATVVAISVWAGGSRSTALPAPGHRTRGS